MDEGLKGIKRVEIKKLWGKYDLVWDLQPDVNILAGINGSGKSTILNFIYKLVTFSLIPDKTSSLFDSAKVILNDGKVVGFIKHKNNAKNQADSDMKKDDQLLNDFIKTESKLHEIEGANFNKFKISGLGLTYSIYNNLTCTSKEFLSDLKINLISTFDSPLKEAEAIKMLSDKNVETELDWQIYTLQIQYLDYQLNLGKKVFDLYNTNNRPISSEIVELKRAHYRFFDIMDDLFSETGKKVNRDKNEISFLNGDQEITPYQLSSGEKQVLVILLTVLVQDNKNAILFLDEPEISLHVDWQKKLISYIRELNPNVQIILATHAPWLIMDGWMDKVVEMRDLITNNQAAIADGTE